MYWFKVNTPLREPYDRPPHKWRISVWCGNPYHHQYCLSIDPGSVFLILPCWLSDVWIMHKLKRACYILPWPIYWQLFKFQKAVKKIIKEAIESEKE